MRVNRIGVAIAMLSLGLVVACSKSSDGKKAAGAKDGTETGKCYGNGTCNPGLICSGSKICVKPPPADCNKVALQMSYIVLGNYAEQAERQKYVTAQAARCQKLAISKEEGECIKRASRPAALNKCRKDLVEVGRCDKMVAHIMQIMKSDPKTEKFRRFLVKATDKMIQRCERKNPTKQVETCVLKAATSDDLRKCGMF